MDEEEFEDEIARRNAEKSLMKLEDQGAIDTFCDLYLKKRPKQLGGILEEAKYSCSEPFGNKILIDLKLGRIKKVSKEKKEVVDELLKALNDPEEIIKSNASKVIHHLKNQGAINELCGLYLEKRKKQLGRFIEKAEYCCSGPFENKILIDLKLGRIEKVSREKKEVVDVLLKALKDPEEVVRENALKVIVKKREFLSKLLRSAIYNDDQRLLDIVREIKLKPSSPTLKALTLFLTGQFKELDEFDPDLELMAEVYGKSKPEMRERIHARITQSGNARYTAIIETEVDAEEGKTSTRQEYTGGALNALIDSFIKTGEYEKAFGLTRFSTFPYILKILRAGTASVWFK